VDTSRVKSHQQTENLNREDKTHEEKKDIHAGKQTGRWLRELAASHVQFSVLKSLQTGLRKIAKGKEFVEPLDR
jgi:hypothetical protein